MIINPQYSKIPSLLLLKLKTTATAKLDNLIRKTPQKNLLNPIGCGMIWISNLIKNILKIQDKLVVFF